MGQLERKIFEILSSFPENTFHTDVEIWQRVQGVFQNVRRDDFARAICEVGRRHGLVGGFFTNGDERAWGFALRSKISDFPNNALLTIGAKFQPHAT